MKEIPKELITYEITREAREQGVCEDLVEPFASSLVEKVTWVPHVGFCEIDAKGIVTGASLRDLILATLENAPSFRADANQGKRHKDRQPKDGGETAYNRGDSPARGTDFLSNALARRCGVRK
jgi:hypothetical protein